MISFTILIFLFLYVVIRQYKKTEEWKRSKLGLYCILVLIFLSGFRHLAVGVDTGYYIYSLRNMSSVSFSEILSSFVNGYVSATNQTKDPGFKLIEKIFSLFTTNSTIYLLCIGSAFLIALRKFFVKYTTTAWELVFSFIVYLVLFFSYLPNAAIRQAIAMAFLLYAYSHFENNKWYKNVLSILLGSFIHQSILAGLIIYLFPLVKNVRRYYVVCGILFSLMFVTGGIFATFISSFSDVYSSYADSDYYNSGNAKPYNFIIFMLLIYLLGLFFIKNKDFVLQNSFLYKMFGVSIVLTPLILIQPNFQRLTAMFAIGACTFLPKCLMVCSSFRRKSIYVLLLVVFMYMTYNNKYKFNWQEMEFNDRYLYMDI